jgi:hypothetical protein
MKREALAAMTLAVFLVLASVGFVSGEPPTTVTDKECFYLRSLHYTAYGMEYWYSKETGGLETITNVPYSKLSCKNCHVAGCDRCHRTETGKRLAYTLKASQRQDMCLECHARQKAMIAIDHAAKQEDVHSSKGMRCTDCHSAREMHGDGIVYKSLKEPGAMDTHCEKCHDSIKPSFSHTVHDTKLDCKACHVRHVVSCANCHFDHMVQQKERKGIPVHGWLFLMNYRGKVSSASMQTFVVRPNKTFLMFAPHMSHSISKEGKKCEDCHGTKTMIEAQKGGALKLCWLEDGKLKNLKGVIPVVEGLKYNCIYQDFVDGKWIPLKDPKDPMVQYVGFGTPLSRRQLEALVEPQELPKAEMKTPQGTVKP